MATTDCPNLPHLPDEMFTIIKDAIGNNSNVLGPRLARLTLSGRRQLETPHFLASTSRGIVPHLTPDTLRRDTRIGAVYVPLEDCMCKPTIGINRADRSAHSCKVIERAPHKLPPIYQFQSTEGSSSLRRFVSLPDDVLLVLGARRSPPVIAPAANPNTNTTVSICTAVGFRQLDAETYAEASESLQPDVVVALGDIPYGRSLGSKRIEKAVDRQIDWLQNHIALQKRQVGSHVAPRLFASLLPVSCRNQEFYIDFLAQQPALDLSGLAVYDPISLEDLPHSLHHLPRLAFTEPATPHQILQQIFLGVDMLTVPFVGIATDAGIALEFTFSVPSESNGTSNGATPRPLGLDMWQPEHAIDLSPLVADCQCYTCVNHHRAYVQHLLAAKEMLGWVLLQIHNHHVLDLFFAGIRKAIGNATFEEGVRHFARVYESELPEKTGNGPRIRGYQFKSEGPGESKKNPSTFVVMNDREERIAEDAAPSDSAAVAGSTLETQGFAVQEPLTRG